MSRLQTPSSSNSINPPFYRLGFFYSLYLVLSHY
nr:MAG TPA_asm: hypothetical protein [Caudoviricetes sp.]